MIKEYDTVKTLTEKEGFPIGTIGVVVSLYKRGDLCEVEVLDEKKYPIDVITYHFHELEII